MQCTRCWKLTGANAPAAPVLPPPLHDESALQSYGQYPSFKRKKFNIDHREGIACLVKLLWGYKFYEEHIFWSKRFLEMTCSKEGTLLTYLSTYHVILGLY